MSCSRPRTPASLVMLPCLMWLVSCSLESPERESAATASKSAETQADHGLAKDSYESESRRVAGRTRSHDRALGSTASRPVDSLAAAADGANTTQYSTRHRRKAVASNAVPTPAAGAEASRELAKGFAEDTRLRRDGRNAASEGKLERATGDGDETPGDRTATDESADAFAGEEETVDGNDGERSAEEDSRAAEVRRRVDDILSKLDRRPGETPAMMFFRYWGDNPFVEASQDKFSTFGVDIDTASYTLLRKYLFERGVLPPAEAVRTEEFVNRFDSEYAPPTEGAAAFALHTEIAPTPFAHGEGYRLLKVGVKAREVSREERKACSLVFVVDTSGSMRQGNRLELVKDALRLLVRELDEGDTIAIVAFDRESRVLLEATPASETAKIAEGIDSLFPRSNTNLEAGLRLGYEVAGRGFQASGNNRVILLSDGVANTGITEQKTILANTEEQRRRGIYLTTIGVGMSNHNDHLLEQLANRGDGQCIYVDRIQEAERAFVENLTGTLQTVARDVKIQVEFDPKLVLRYRQLGYENRAIRDADFRDNKVDAGEVGAGHEVTALYEVKLSDLAKTAAPDAALATVRLRYLLPTPRPAEGGGEAVEMEHPARLGELSPSFEKATPRFQLSALVAEFAEIARESYWARGGDLAAAADRVESLLSGGQLETGEDERRDLVELVALMRKADALVRARDAADDEVAMVIDGLRENSYHRWRAEETAEGPERSDYLERLERQNTELRLQLESLLDR